MPTPAVEPSPHLTARRATPQRDPIRLVSLLLIYLCLAVTYVILTPPGEGVDEMPHFDYVRFVHDQRRLPVNREGQPIEAWMAHHPPLYYALGALVIAPFDTGDRSPRCAACGDLCRRSLLVCARGAASADARMAHRGRDPRRGGAVDQVERGDVIAGARVSDSIVIPGQGLDVITDWAADEDTVDFADPYVEISLVTDEGVLLGSATFWSEISTIPAVWGERIVENRQSFYIPPGQLSGTVRVEMQIRDGIAGPLLPVQGSGETVVTLAELLALGAVAEIDPSALPAPPREEIFAEVLRLAGSTLPPQVVPGGVLSVELYWQVTASIPADYTVFVHVLDAGDQIVAQLDRPPGGGTSPTSSWQQGQTLRDTYPVPLPADLPPGEYRVRVGLYTWPDLARQPITVDGQQAGDSLILGAFQVAPP